MYYFLEQVTFDIFLTKCWKHDHRRMLQSAVSLYRPENSTIKKLSIIIIIIIR